MGVIGFIYVNYHAISGIELTGVLMVLLYISGPVGGILNIMPQLARSRISLAKVDALFEDLPSENVSEVVKSVPEWTCMRFDLVTYGYGNDSGEGKPFSVGPISSQINRGEVTFIVGGNGSGKSTLSKVMSLHYLAESGSIFFDDVPVTPDNINSYRQEIACIYSDYYLFKQLHGHSASHPNQLEKIDEYLGLLGLSEKVKFCDGSFSTLNLSDGQRRRLALLVALLDDKEIYVFDEWAADQDPQFKEVFYHEFLPMLKARGKAVIAISHDDRYFDVADQILTMESGELVGTTKNPGEAKKPLKTNSEDGDRKYAVHPVACSDFDT